MFAQDFSKIVGRIEETAANRQRHWDRMARCARHEIDYRADRVRYLTIELDDLYALKRELLAAR